MQTMAENEQSPPAPIRTVVEAPAAWKRVVKAEVDRELFDREYATRLKKAAKNHQKPGFRKGKTPRAVVERELGQSLRMETIEALIPRAWMGAVVEHELRPLTDPELENLEFPDGGPLRFDLVVEVKPEIELGDCDGLRVRRRAIAVADGDVDDVLDRLRESRAVWDKVERPAAPGDRLTLDLIPGAWEGEPAGGQPIVDQQFVLGEESNLPAFNDSLGGVAAGETRSVSVAYPEDHPNERLRGRTIEFRCEIKEVAAKTVPAADDAFAAAVEEGKTLLELRTDIRADLERDASRRVDLELDEQVLRELVARHDVPLPPSMLERYLDSSVQELHRRNARYGRQSSAEEDEEYREAAKPHAEKALRGMLLLEAVRRREDIKVTPAEVDEKIDALAAENGFPVDDYRKFVNSGDRKERERIEFDLLERRTYDFLLSRAAIEDVPADTDVLDSE
jgi:trigger factor